MVDATQAILGFQAPKVKSAFERSQEQQQNALGQMQLQNAFESRQASQRALQEDTEAKTAYQESGGDLAKARELLYGKGLYKQGAVVDKQIADGTKTKAETYSKQLESAKKHNELFGQVFGYVSQNATPENAKQLALQGLEQLRQSGALPDADYQKAIQTMPEDPAQIKALATQYFQSALDAKDQLSKYETRNTGGSTDTVAISPVSGQVKVVNSVNNTQSPDSVASISNNNTQKQLDRDNAITVAGIRKSGESTGSKAPSGYQFNPDGSLSPIKGGPADKASGAGGKPLPTAALKLQQEELDAIGTAASINADLGAVQKQIDSGKLKFGLVDNIVNGVRNKAGISSEESRNFGSFKTTMERLRNDSLRLNKGVQTDGDAQRAWNELFDNINDQGVVKQRLQEIQRLNSRAVNLRKMNIDGIRSNYGKDPIDTTGYEDQPSSLGTTSTKPTGKVKSAADFLKKNGL